MSKKNIVLISLTFSVLMIFVLTSCTGSGGVPPIVTTNAQNTAELIAALQDELAQVIYLTGDVYEVSDLEIPSGKRLVGPNSPDYPEELSQRGTCILMPAADSDSGALVRIHAFSSVKENIAISGLNFQLPADYEWNNIHNFMMIFIQGNSADASSTLSNIMVSDCIFDYTTAPDAPEGVELSTAININTSEVTKAENINIEHNTFKLKTSNTDACYEGIFVVGTANDTDKGIKIRENTFFGGLENTGRAPSAIAINSAWELLSAGRDGQALHVSLNKNIFYGKDEQNQPLTYVALVNFCKRALDLTIQMNENQFGTIDAPLIANNANDCLLWLGFDDTYPSGTIRFTGDCNNNAFTLLANQHRIFADFMLPEQNPENYNIQFDGQDIISPEQLSSAFVPESQYHLIINTVERLDHAMNEPIPKEIYILPGIYDGSYGSPKNHQSLIGPLSPDYPQSFAQGEAVFRPIPGTCCFNILHFLNVGDLEIAEDFQKENIRFSGLTFRLPSDFNTTDRLMFFEMGVFFGEGEDSKRTVRDLPNWYLKDFSIDHCLFDLDECPFDSNEISCIGFNSEYCTFEDINLSDNSFYLKTLNEETGRIFGIDGIGGSHNSENYFKINHNLFSGCDLDVDGNSPICITLYPDFDINTADTYYFEIKNNIFEGNKGYGRILQTHNAKKMQIDFSANLYGSEQIPFRNDINGNGAITIFFLNNDNPVTFSSSQGQSTYFISAPEEEVAFIYAVNYFDGTTPPEELKLYYNQEQVTAEQMQNALFEFVE